MLTANGASLRQFERTHEGHGAFTRRICCVVSLAIFASGCTTMVTYAPRPSQDTAQTLKYTQGVGTLAEKDETRELFVYPRFKAQGPAQPTFTIGYANNTAEPVNFSPANVKAFFRGAPIQIYTFDERIAEIRAEKQGKQIALAIIGGLAAAGAAYGASRQTYRSNYSGYSAGPRGVRSFAGSETVRVRDPLAGVVAGAAVGGATVLGIQQIEYSADNQERSAESILELNTVEPQQMVTGDLILKNCCDAQPGPNDVVRLEVTTNDKTSVFEFVRNQVPK